MASCHKNGVRAAHEEKVVEPAPGPVRRQVYRLLFVAAYSLGIFAIVSFAVGTVNLWSGDVIPWPINQASR